MNKVFQFNLNRLFLILIFFNGTINSQPVEHPIPGEKIDFLVSFGIFSAGKATMSTAIDKYSINDKETFKIDIKGRTTGVFDFFARVRDNWGSYVNESEFKPEKFYRYLAEGKYRKNEILNFQNDSDSVQIEVLDKETKKFIEYKYLHFEDDIQKIVRSYFMNYWIASLAYLRSLDYDSANYGDLIDIPYFEDNSKFSYQMKFIRKEEIDSKIGKFNSIVLSPLIPEKNKLFKEEDAVKFWITDDEKKIPLMLEAKMNFGNFVIEIDDYSNVK
tara:strand:+ start:46 stop:864 length:819 start_codon:yes stop_codon:yes gene_type:complete